MSFCLPQEFANKFIDALKSGKIDPAKLSNMSSAERRSFFEDIVGKDDAKEVNAKFESKLLLKNKQAGMISWAKKVSGISEPVRKDLLSRISKLNEKDILSPSAEDAFLKDLASKTLGTEVSFEEAKTISDLSRELDNQKTGWDETSGKWKSVDAQLKYGALKVKLIEYVKELKTGEHQTVMQKAKQAAADIKERPIAGTVDSIKSAAFDLAGLAKSLKSTLDNSLWFRQMLKPAITNPKIWADNFVQSWVDIGKTLKRGDESMLDETKADVFSRPNAMNGLYDDMKIDIGTGEESFPTAFPERIPGLGRLFKASKIAYEAGAIRMRADLADKYIEIAKRNGVDVTDIDQSRPIGKMVNAMTGRGYLGKGEAYSKEINVAFFSPKMLKGNIDFLTAHQLQKGVTPFVRKQAAINLLKTASGLAAVLAIAETISPKSVETDPRSADFLKIRVGDTRFDISGGMGSLITLAARIASGSSKSSTTGKVSELNSGKYGATTKTDLFYNFMENKLSPIGALMKHLLEGRDFQGNKITFLGETINLLAPLPSTNTYELVTNPRSAPVIIGMIADGLGIGTNTYSAKK